MAEPAALVAQFVSLLADKAAIFGAAVLYIMRYRCAFKDDNGSISTAHSAGLHNLYIPLVDRPSCGVVSTVVLGNVVYDSLDGVFGRHRVSGELTPLFSGIFL